MPENAWNPDRSWLLQARYAIDKSSIQYAWANALLAKIDKAIEAEVDRILGGDSNPAEAVENDTMSA